MRVFDRTPRLTKAELESLVRIRKQLDAVYDTIRATNLQSRPALELHLVQIAEVIDNLVNKAMARVAKLLSVEGTEPVQDARLDLEPPILATEGQKPWPEKREG